MSERILLHGGDYNPEQWLDRPEVLEQDVQLMQRAHVNSVSVGIFSWAKLEPEENVYDLDWLGEIIDRLWAHGVGVILATPSGARPNWMAQRYPEVLRVNAKRERSLFGGRENHCLTSPVYRDKVRKMDQILAKRFGKHPAVRYWHISNEFNGECHCPLCQASFRRWLQAKYGSLEALNQAWYTTFWSHTYTDWSQVESPSPLGESGLQGLLLDWRRFVSWQTIDFYKFERDSIREVLPEARCTTNLMDHFDGFDHWDMSREMDIISWDSYPEWHNPRETEEQTALRTAFVHDIYYSLQDKPFLLMESTPSNTNWQAVSRPKEPGMHIQSSLLALAQGSDAVMYFQWRRSRGAMEKLHGGVVGPDGREDNRVYLETAAVGRALQDLTFVAGERKPKQAAIVLDYQNKWVLDAAQGPRNCGIGYWEEMHRHYDGLRHNGYSVDFLPPMGDLSAYPLVIVPMLYMMDDETIQNLRGYVQNGGHLVVTAWSGIADENDQLRQGDTPYGLTDLLGLRVTETVSLWDGETVSCQSRSMDLPNTQGSILCDVPALEGAEPLLQYGSAFFAGTPAITCNRFGEGTAWFVATRFPGDFYTSLYKMLCRESGMAPIWRHPVPEGVLLSYRGPYVFLQNWNRTAVSLETGKGTLTLHGWGTAVLEQDGTVRYVSKPFPFPLTEGKAGTGVKG